MFPYKVDIQGKKKDLQSIYCIGRNFVDHIEELKNEIPDKPLVFVKPKGAILIGNELQIPDNTMSLQHECEIVLSMGKSGENIAKEKASSYIDGITLGLDMTARDLQDTEKKKGQPWTLSKCQKGFAVIGKWSPFIAKEYEFELLVNGVIKQKGDTKKMMYKFSDIICYLSSIVPLYEGDIIFTGTPAGVAAIKSKDMLEGTLDGKSALSLIIR